MDGADPDFAVKAEHIKTVAGASIKLAGTVKDADGIKDIRLECKEIGLNKIIDIISIYGEPLKEYELDFSYKIQQDVQGDSFNVDIYIDDVAGKTTKKTVLVTLDADFTAPVDGTDWWNEVINDVALVQNYSLGVRGGNDKFIYSFSLGYFRNNSQYDVGYWDKLNLRLNTEYNFTDWLKVGLDLAPNMENWDDTPNLFGAAQSMDPTTPVFRPEDQWDLENPMNNYQRSYNNQEWNPAGNLARMDSKTRKFQLLANPFIEIRPIKQLILRTQFGLNFWMQRNDWYNCAFHIADLEKRDKDEVGRKYSDGLNWTWNNTITYTDTYADKHNLTVMAGCRNGVGDGWSWGQPTSDLENAYIAAGDTERLRWTIIKTGCTEIAGEDQFNKFIENNLTKDSYQGGIDNSEFQDCKKLFGWTDDYITTRYLIKPSQHKSARIIRKYFVPLAQRPEVYNICKIPLNHRILRFADVLLMYAEAAAWNYLYEYDNNNRGRTNQIQELFDPASENYIGDLGSVDKVVAGHSYWSFDNWKSMRDVRKRVSDAASAKNLRVWQTEWSMLDKEPSELGGTYDNVSEFDIAQYMSRVIHNDIVMAGCTSWCYWTAMSVERYSQKNRFELIKTTPAGGNYSNDFTSAGNVDATHNLWVLGNYSHFIRPGYIRIGLKANEDKDFFGTAYVSPDGKTVVAVYTNYDKEKGVTLTNSFDNGKTPKTVTRYTTTATRHLEEDRFNVADNVFLEPASVTTVVYTFE